MSDLESLQFFYSVLAYGATFGLLIGIFIKFTK